MNHFVSQDRRGNLRCFVCLNASPDVKEATIREKRRGAWEIVNDTQLCPHCASIQCGGQIVELR